jgi:hypothetical protein
VQLYRYFVSQSNEFCCHNPLCCFLTIVCGCIFSYRLSPETFGYTLVASYANTQIDLAKFALCLIKYYAMKTHPVFNRRHEETWVSGGIAPRILNLRTKWRWVVSLTPRPLYSREKSYRYPLDRRLGGPRTQYGRCGPKKKNHHWPRGESNPAQPSRSWVTILTELFRLLQTERYSAITYSICPSKHPSITSTVCLSIRLSIYLHNFIWQYTSPLFIPSFLFSSFLSRPAHFSQ